MNPYWLAILSGLVGLLAGMLINYLADVLPVYRKLTHVQCPACGKAIGVGRYALLLSCPACGRRRGPRPTLVQAVCLGGFIWLALDPPARLGLAAGGFWLAYLLLVIVIDVEHRLILHWVTGLGALAALATGIGLHGVAATLLGGAAGFLAMLAFYGLGIAYARWSSRRRGAVIAEGEALGFGDVTLSGVIGLLLGWPGVIAGLIVAVFLAGAVGLLAMLPMLFRRQYDPNLALPYGPFLALGAFYLLYLRP